MFIMGNIMWECQQPKVGKRSAKCQKVGKYKGRQNVGENVSPICPKRHPNVAPTLAQCCPNVGPMLALLGWQTNWHGDGVGPTLGRPFCKDWSNVSPTYAIWDMALMLEVASNIPYSSLQRQTLWKQENLIQSIKNAWKHLGNIINDFGK